MTTREQEIDNEYLRLQNVFYIRTVTLKRMSELAERAYQEVLMLQTLEEQKELTRAARFFCKQVDNCKIAYEITKLAISKFALENNIDMTDVIKTMKFNRSAKKIEDKAVKKVRADYEEYKNLLSWERG